jgi:predicted O-methyltransferase YrrM
MDGFWHGLGFEDAMKMAEGNVTFRALTGSSDSSGTSWLSGRTRHPLFLWFGLRPAFAQHTRMENEALERWASKRRSVVEIGVAEGASALTLREAMSADGTLYLIDPFHLSRVKWINSQRRAAGATVARSRNGDVVWIEKFSSEASRDWASIIDFLFIDGDHDEKAVWQDWDAWHSFVATGGCVAFHDAREFTDGWPVAEDGPVRVVNSLFREKPIPGWEIVEEADSLVIVRRSA